MVINGGSWNPARGIRTRPKVCFFQFVFVMPKYNTVIAKASAYDDYWSVPLQLEQFTAFDAIGRALEKN